MIIYTYIASWTKFPVPIINTHCVYDCLKWSLPNDSKDCLCSGWGGGDPWFMTTDAIGYSHCEFLKPNFYERVPMLSNHRENGCKLIIEFYL